LMLYAELGRMGIYHFQDMYRLLSVKRDPKLARNLVSALPQSNWLKQNSKRMLTSDFENFADSGVTDLLLHHCDRPYRVGDIVRLGRRAGMRLLEFTDTQKYGVPESLMADPKIRKIVDNMSTYRRYAFAELARGDVDKHNFYLVGHDNAISPAHQLPIKASHILCRPDTFLGNRYAFPAEALNSIVANPHQRIHFSIDNNQHSNLPALVAFLIPLVDCRRTIESLGENVAVQRSKLKHISAQEWLNVARELVLHQGTSAGRYWFVTEHPFSGLPSHITPMERPISSYRLTPASSAKSKTGGEL